MDTAVSLLAAELFHGPVPGGQVDLSWDDYPEQVVDRGWRLRAMALQEALDTVGPPGGSSAAGPARAAATGRAGAPTLDRLLERLASGGGDELARALAAQGGAPAGPSATPSASLSAGSAACSTVSPALGPAALAPGAGERGGRELLADCVTAMVCCAAVDSSRRASRPGLAGRPGAAARRGAPRRSGRPGGRGGRAGAHGPAAQLAAGGRGTPGEARPAGLTVSQQLLERGSLSVSC